MQPAYHTIDTHLQEDIKAVYARVFGGAPWYEQLACKDCGEIYGEPKKTLAAIADDHCISDICTSNGD